MSDFNVKDKAMENAKAEKEIIQYAVKIMNYASNKLELISKEADAESNDVNGTIDKIELERKSAHKTNTENTHADETYETKGPIDNIREEKKYVNNTNATNGTFSFANAKREIITTLMKRIESWTTLVEKKDLSENANERNVPTEKANGEKDPSESASGKNEHADNVNAKVRPAQITELRSGPVVNGNSKEKPIDNITNEGRPDDLMNIARTKMQSDLNGNSNVNLKMRLVSYADSKEVPFPNAGVRVDVPNAEVSVDDLDSEEKEELRRQVQNFVENLEQYLTRCYDIVKQRFSIIAMHHTQLLPSCRVLLKGCLGRYKKSQLFRLFQLTVEYDNRRTLLKSIVKEVLIIEGRKVSHSEFLRISATYLLLGYDLNRMTPFWDAPDYIIKAISEAIMETKQRNYISLWFTNKCTPYEFEQTIQ